MGTYSMMSRGRFVDVSERAVVSLKGPESLDLLQRISTNDVTRRNADGAIQTVFTNEKGRIVEVAYVLDDREEGLLVGGQAADPLIMKQWIEKYIIMEDINVRVLSGQFIHLMVFDSLHSVVDVMRPAMPPGCRIFEETLASTRLTHVLTAKSGGDAATNGLMEAGFRQSDRDDYEEYRVLHGIPGFPGELSTSYNPLEAGLLPLVSFTKGCYIGQEVVARLDTYKKVQRRLVQLRMEELPSELPEKIYFERQEWGSITSALRFGGSHECRGLGYVKVGPEASIENLYFHIGGKEIKLVIDSQGAEAT
jgi:folate-binding protein YgfZ